MTDATGDPQMRCTFLLRNLRRDEPETGIKLYVELKKADYVFSIILVFLKTYELEKKLLKIHFEI